MFSSVFGYVYRLYGIYNNEICKSLVMCRWYILTRMLFSLQVTIGESNETNYKVQTYENEPFTQAFSKFNAPSQIVL